MNDILLKMNSQHVTMLILLDLSAAFDTVDHGILLGRLSDEVGILGTALNWFTSYLSDRSQRVSVHGVPSRPFDLNCGVLQGSCLGTLLFIIYASKLFKIVEHYGIGQIEASTCPPPPGIPRAFDTFAVPGRREFDYESLPGGGEFDRHPIGVGDLNCTLDFM